MSMMRARVRGHRWVDHPAAAVMKARVPGQWVDCPAAVVMEAREQGRCWIDHPAVAVMEARVQGRHWVDRPSVGAEASADVLQVRLVGPLPDRGRLEVNLFNQSWGTVCDDYFDTQDAAVVCSMLGLPIANAQVKQSGIYGAGSSSQKIWLDDLRCTGNETSIILCPHNGLGIHNCRHSEDVGVFCSPPASGE
ncbi:hypothetical protein ACOMHN_023662 [Nucella lapillus]